MTTFLSSPLTGFGVGLILGCVGWLITVVVAHREYRVLSDENAQLRLANAQANGHPAFAHTLTANEFDLPAFVGLVDRNHRDAFQAHTADAERRLRVVPPQRDGGAR